MMKKNFGDWAVALVVVICSVILCLALGFALTGTILGKPARTLRANFHDVIGINISANVKYAGALAGKVASIRMLNAEERKASGDPLNAVQIELALNKNVPELPSDITVSVSSDTLLSDKLIQISGGTINASPLADNAVVQGVTPVTFDRLVRDVDHAVDGLNGLLAGGGPKTGDIFDRLRALLTNVEGLITEAHPVVQDAGSLIKQTQPVVKDAGELMSDARQLVQDNRVPITQAVTTLNKAAGSLDQLATRGIGILNTHEQKIATTLADFRVTMENLKITATYARFLTRNLALRPQQLLWGNKRPPALPSEEQILKSPRPVDLH
jgi:ABC-type transporter Mla subunit MlaD